jgi:hypothetical protein
MRPLNLDNSPCTPTASNCVIWSGPNIPCIKLCTGDTISDVVFKLATELCTLLDQTNVTTYDLACFNLAACPPTTFDQLIQLLIDKICALENIDLTTTTTTTSTTSPGKSTTSSALVSDYLLTAAPCLGGGTIGLVDYVNLIATRLCEIVTEITVINAAINSLDIRVIALESAPVPVFVLPTFTLQCAISTLPALSVQAIDTVLEAFINDEWCPYKATFGTYSNLSTAVTSQCVSALDDALAAQYSSPGTTMLGQYPAYIGTPTTVADAINNIWIALCDARNAGKADTTVTAGDNVTVTPTVTVVGANQTTDYLIDGKDTVVAAGDNITITPAGPVAGVTTYTVDGLSTVVTGADDIVVTPTGPVAGVTTYAISRPKQNFFDQVVGWADVQFDPGPATYHFPLGYSGLTYTNATGATKTFAVHVNYDTSLTGPGTTLNNNINLINWLDGAIIKTVVGVDTVQYESFAGRLDISGSLFNGILATDIVNLTSTETVVTTPGNYPVEFRFLNGEIQRNIAFFSMVTLNNGESVSLKFKAKDALTPALLGRAQILVTEL